MSNEMMLDVGQANELKLALRREGWNNEELKMACERKGFLGLVRETLLGRAEIKMIEHLIDFDAKPSVPDGWTILPDSEQLPNRVRGQMKFDPSKVKLHLDSGQKNGSIEGNKLLKKLTKESVYGAQLLDFYLANPHLIPEEWKGKAIFFWGTIYRSAVGRSCVRCLYWRGGGWGWDYIWLGLGWGGSSPALVSGK